MPLGPPWACLLLLFATASCRTCAADLLPDTARCVLDATVQIRTPSRRASGVLFERSGTAGLILTRAVVVRDLESVEVLLLSPVETNLAGRVICCDEALDLACILITNAVSLPAPLPWQVGRSVTNGETVYVSECGDLLLPTIRPARVVPLPGRPEPGLELPGWSGSGPVVSREGTLVGLAAAPFISPGRLDAFLAPPVRVSRLRLARRSAEFVEVEATLGRLTFGADLQEIGVVYARGPAPKQGTLDKRVSWPRLLEASRPVSLPADLSRGRSTIGFRLGRLPTDNGPVYLWVQPFGRFRDGSLSWGEPVSLPVQFATPEEETLRALFAPEPVPAVLPDGQRQYALRPPVTPVAKYRTPGVWAGLTLSADHRHLFALDLVTARLLKLRADDLSVVAAVDVSPLAWTMAAAPDGQTIYVIGRRTTRVREATTGAALLNTDTGVGEVAPEGLVEVVRTSDLSVPRRIPLDFEAGEAAANSWGLLVLGSRLIDARTGRVLQVLPGQSVSPPVLHPNGLTLWRNESLVGFSCTVLSVDENLRQFRTARSDTVARGWFNPAGDVLALPDGTLFGVDTGQHTLRRNEARLLPFTSIAFAPDSHVFFTSTADGKLCAYEASRFQLQQVYPLDRPCARLLLAPKERRLYAVATPPWARTPATSDRRGPSNEPLPPLTVGEIVAFALEESP